MKKIAVCIPTYNRIDLIREFLETQTEIYFNNNIDIWIYDSNEGDECKKLVNKYSEIYNNIFYVSIASSVHSNEKVMRIYQGQDRGKKYEYLWLSQDAYRITDNELKEIISLIDREYDIITISNDDVECIGSKEYQNLLFYFRDAAWKLTGYGNCIVKTSTMTDNVNWNYINGKYLDKSCINYSHVGYYFEQLLNINNPHMYFKHVYNNEYYWSSLKKQSAWTKDTFHIICNVWPALVNKLPSFYDYMKNEVIKSLGVKASILSYRKFINLRKLDVYNENIFNTYKGNWNKYCDLDEEFLEKLALIRPDEVERFEWERLEAFCKKFSRIYIYGCGIISKHIVDLLERNSQEWEAFLVTKDYKHSGIIHNHPVIRFEKILLNKETGIIMGLRQSYYNEIVKEFNLGNKINQLLVMY